VQIQPPFSLPDNRIHGLCCMGLRLPLKGGIILAELTQRAELGCAEQL
jgi:hypothetical protein